MQVFSNLFVQTVSNSSSSWFIDDTQNIQARDGPASLVACRWESLK